MSKYKKKLFTGNLKEQHNICPMMPSITTPICGVNSIPICDNAIKENRTAYSPADVIYKSNSHGFRCDEFEETNSPVIVFTGCSYTFGLCVPLEDVWAYRIIKRLREEVDPNIKYFNIAKAGSSIDAMIRALLTFRKHYNPDVVVGLLPPRWRIELFCDPGEIKDLVHQSVNLRKLFSFDISSETEKETLLKYEELFLGDPFLDAYRLSKNLAMFDMYREITGCEMILSSWQKYDELFEHIGDDYSHLFTPFWMDPDITWPVKIIGKTSKYALDGGHPGPAHNEAFAHLMYPLVKAAVEKKIINRKTSSLEELE